jgi:phage shock protein A
MPDGLWGILIPVIAATVILVGGAFVVRSYAGPAQIAYTAAVEGRMRTLTSERDDLSRSLDRLNAEVEVLRSDVSILEKTVQRLERELRELTVENLALMRAAGKP